MLKYRHLRLGGTELFKRKWKLININKIINLESHFSVIMNVIIVSGRIMDVKF